MDSNYSQYDLRRMKVGGWEASNLKSKVNGKWVYFYNADDNKLINCRELIDFEKKYVPPNHRPKKRTVVTRSLEKRGTENYRAPLQFSHHPRLLAPVVYSSFTTTRAPQHLAKNTRSKTACRIPKTSLLPNKQEGKRCTKTSQEPTRGMASSLPPKNPVPLNDTEKIEEISDYDSQNSSVEE